MAALHQFFVANPAATHTHTIILLHGRGSTGEEFAKELFECAVENTGVGLMNLKERFPACKWIFPSAKSRYSTVFQEEMTEWFDIYSLTSPNERPELQKAGLADAAQLLKILIHEESAKVPPGNMIIGGISQGYAVAALILMGLNLRMAGFLGLSGWIPFSEQIKVEVSGTSRGGAHAATVAARKILGFTEEVYAEEGGWSSTSIFLGHEEHDPIIDYKLGRVACDLFEICGGEPEWHIYDSGDHWIQEPNEISDLVHFLARCIIGGKAA